MGPMRKARHQCYVHLLELVVPPKNVHCVEIKACGQQVEGKLTQVEKQRIMNPTQMPNGLSQDKR